MRRRGRGRAARAGRCRPRPRRAAAARRCRGRGVPPASSRRSSVHLTAVILPNQPTTNASPGIPCRRRTSASVAVEGDARLELDTEADDRELRPGRDPESDELVPHLGAHRDQAVADARERRLDRTKQHRARAPEVAAQDMPVEGVDDDGPLRAREHRRRAPDRARLRRVRVDDVRPDAPDELREPPGGDERRGTVTAPARARGAGRPRRRRGRRRTPSTPRRARRRRRRASSRTRAPRGRARGTSRAAQARRR